MLPISEGAARYKAELVLTEQKRLARQERDREEKAERAQREEEQNIIEWRRRRDASDADLRRLVAERAAASKAFLDSLTGAEKDAEEKRRALLQSQRSERHAVLSRYKQRMVSVSEEANYVEELFEFGAEAFQTCLKELCDDSSPNHAFVPDAVSEFPLLELAQEPVLKKSKSARRKSRRFKKKNLK